MKNVYDFLLRSLTMLRELVHLFLGQTLELGFSAF